MSECLTKLPTRVERRREEGGETAEKERLRKKKKQQKTKTLDFLMRGNKIRARFETGID